MKTYYIKYRRSLGDFLDEKSIPWSSVSDDEISIELNNDTDLFELGNEFQEWKNKYDF